MLEYLSIANKKMEELGLFNKYVGCYPMFRLRDKDLSIVVYYIDCSKDKNIDVEWEVVMDAYSKEVICCNKVNIMGESKKYDYHIKDRYKELMINDFTKGEENCISDKDGFWEWFNDNLGGKMDVTLSNIEDMVWCGREAYLNYYYDELFDEVLGSYLNEGVILEDKIYKSLDLIKEFYRDIKLEGLV